MAEDNPEGSDPPDLSPNEATFLLAMYGQLWNNINRHVLIVWQPLATIGAALGLFSLVDKGVLSIDWATTLVVVVAVWFVTHTLDASTWFNRNQAMIARIENLFLPDALKNAVGEVVGKPRKQGKAIDHFVIQSALGYAVAVLMLAHHVAVRVMPTWRLGGHPDPSRWLPYLAAVVGLVLIRGTKSKTN
jgi:hypothetical protein